MLIFMLLSFFIQLAFCHTPEEKVKLLDELNQKYGMKYLGLPPFGPTTFQNVGPNDDLLVCKNRAVACDDQRWHDVIKDHSCDFPEYDEYILLYERILNS